MISGDPLDEIAVSPSFIGGCSLMEMFLLMIFTMIESVWVSIWVSRLFMSFSILAFPVGVGYFFFRLYRRYKRLGRLKRDLPSGQYAIYQMREISRHFNFTFIGTILMIVIFTHILSVFISSFIGNMPLGFLIGSFMSVLIIKKSYNNIYCLTPSKLPQLDRKIISKSTTFSTSRHH